MCYDLFRSFQLWSLILFETFNRFTVIRFRNYQPDNRMNPLAAIVMLYYGINHVCWLLIGNRMSQPAVSTCRASTGSCSTTRRWRPRTTFIASGARLALASAARPWFSCPRLKRNSSPDSAAEASSTSFFYSFTCLLSGSSPIELEINNPVRLDLILVMDW